MPSLSCLCCTSITWHPIQDPTRTPESLVLNASYHPFSVLFNSWPQIFPKSPHLGKRSSTMAGTWWSIICCISPVCLKCSGKVYFIYANTHSSDIGAPLLFSPDIGVAAGTVFNPKCICLFRVIWNCLTATDMVSWLQTMWVLAQVWVHELNFLTHPSSKCAMAWHWWPINISSDTITPIIGPICVIWNCLAATDMVSCLQIMWVLAQVWGHELNFLTHPSSKCAMALQMGN
jgi:hypothetical protein